MLDAAPEVAWHDKEHPIFTHLLIRILKRGESSFCQLLATPSLAHSLAHALITSIGAISSAGAMRALYFPAQRLLKAALRGEIESTLEIAAKPASKDCPVVAYFGRLSFP